MPADHTLERLHASLQVRKDADAAESYTAKLLAAGPVRIAKKLGEEGVETALAGAAGSEAEVVAESADLLYHLAVLWIARGVEPEAVWAELERRMGTSGIAEKASREES